MKTAYTYLRGGLCGEIILGASLVVAGCGGESTSPPAPTASAPAADAPAARVSNPAAKSALLTSGPGGKASKDVDLSAREKRNLRKGIKPPE